MIDFYDNYDETADPMDYGQPDLYPWDLQDYSFTNYEVNDDA